LYLAGNEEATDVIHAKLLRFPWRRVDCFHRHFPDLHYDICTADTPARLWAYIDRYLPNGAAMLRHMGKTTFRGDLVAVYGAMHDLKISWAPAPREYPDFDEQRAEHELRYVWQSRSRPGWASECEAVRAGRAVSGSRDSTCRRRHDRDESRSMSSK
jgi:hypothetical protein